ncbi:MAG: hypothetical protein ACYDHW_09495 [Syntrophorhabdaceae bacterium]
MTQIDTFDRDPQVRYMRRIFSAIENAQNGFLAAINIRPDDARLRPVRETALKSFERSWMLIAGRVNGSDIEAASTVYLICLARALSSKNIPVPDNPISLSWDPYLEKMVDEVLK